MLKEIIDDFYQQLEREKRDHERIRFYISEAKKCPRQIFLKFKRAPQREMESEYLRILEMGDHVQQIVLGPLFSKGIVRATEVKIPPQEIITGRADAIVSVDGEPYVLEIKSVSGRIDPKKLPMEEHKNQLQLYLHFFKIKKGILLYATKDTLEIKEFILEYDPVLCEEILKWFEDLKEKIEKNIVPLALSDFPKNWQCERCPFLHLCELVPKEELTWEEFKETLKKAEILMEES